MVDRVAEVLREALTLLAEHHGDEELALVTEVLAEATLLAAVPLDIGGCFETG